MSSARTAWLRYLACLVILCWMPAVVHGVVTATVEPSTVTVDESFYLILESDGVADGEPDVSAVERDFEIINQSRNQNVSIVEGRVSRRTSWEIELLPVKSGFFTIPAIDVGSESTNPVDILVRPPGAPGRDGPSHFLLEVEVDEHAPYIQQQIVYTVRVYRSANATSARLSEPVPEGVDALVERLGKDTNSASVRGGRRYQVIERRYAIFPQGTGTMVVPPLQFQAKVIERSNSRGLLGSVRTRSIRVRSEALEITVREPPAGAPPAWLPARMLSLSESWAAGDLVSVGDTLTRRIGVRAVGLTAEQLPELDLAPPEGMKQYPEAPDFENVIEAEGIAGTRVQTTALVAVRPGTFTLPAVTVAWWNVVTGRVEEATIPPRTIEVTGTVAAPEPVAPPESAVPDAGQAGSGQGAGTPGYWPWVSGALALAWLLTLWRWRAERRRYGPRREPASGRSPQDRDEALAALRRACANHDPGPARDALLAWAAATWPQAPPANLSQIGRRCGDAVARAVDDLQRTLYAPGQAAPWDGTGLWENLSGLERSGTEAPRSNSPGLEPLYRTRGGGQGGV